MLDLIHAVAINLPSKHELFQQLEELWTSLN